MFSDTLETVKRIENVILGMKRASAASSLKEKMQKMVITNLTEQNEETKEDSSNELGQVQ